MKDQTKMKPTVSAMDGSRFATLPQTPEPLNPPMNRVLASRMSVTLPEESLVEDDRANQSPAQMVETKLIHRLRESSLPVSHLQLRGLVRNRFEA